jgi:cytochrome c
MCRGRTSVHYEPIAAPHRVGLNKRKVKHMNKRTTSFIVTALAAAACGLLAPAAYAVDADAALALARQNNCLKCHAIDKDKDGPAYKKVAEKYKGKATAEARLIEHITSGEKAKFPDGHEEEHKIVKTNPPKDEAQIKNLVQWILSQ